MHFIKSNNNLTTIEQSFQDGCDRIMAAVTAKGTKPDSNNVNDIIRAIANIQTDIKHNIKVNVSLRSDHLIEIWVLVDNTQTKYYKAYVSENLSTTIYNNNI